MVANKIHSLNLIMHNQIYEFRGIMSHEGRTLKLLQFLEESILSSHKNCELVIACLKSMKNHVAVA